MTMRTYRFIIALSLALPICVAAQNNSSDDVFTISVAAPVSPKDVQVRYFLNGGSMVQEASSIAKPEDAGIVVKTGASGKTASSFRAIVYSPGCQFATIQADDLSTSTRQVQFQCQKLTTTTLHGRTDAARFAVRDLQVQALYVCGWAGKFFGIPGIAISPFSVTRAHVETDGSFSVELPDFTGDPLWTNLSHNATLMFSLVDARTGEPLAGLTAPSDLSRKGALKVAASYPAEVQFAIR